MAADMVGFGIDVIFFVYCYLPRGKFIGLRNVGGIGSANHKCIIFEPGED